MMTISLQQMPYRSLAIAIGIVLVTLFGAHSSVAQWSSSSGVVYTTNSSDKVGIGTTPAFKFTIQLDGTTAQQIAIQNDNTTAGRYSEFLFRHSNGEGPAGIRAYAVNLGSNNESQLRFFTSPSSNSPTERMTIDQSGNVGIGTTSPSFKLHIFGTSDNQLKLDNDGSTYTSLYWANNGTVKGQAYYNVSSNQFRLGGSGSNTVTVLTSNTDTERMRIDAVGNVGIGTTTPQVRFDFGTSVANQKLIIGTYTTGNFWSGIGMGPNNAGLRFAGDVGGGMLADFVFYSNDANHDWTSRMYINTSGYVGIGTTSPAGRLHADGLSGAWSGVFTNTSSAGSSQGVIIDAGGSVSDYSLRVRQRLGGAEYFAVRGDGNVGIGTSTPGYKLDVNGNANVQGNITASGSIAAKYQDVAEWVPTSEQLAAGTVVVLDATKSNQVISSTVAYDTRVAGVISAQPGITLGEKSDGKVLVATTGRVKVKVDATKAPIHIGDLLVTSDVPGVAMKSEAVNLGGVQIHRPGTLIGKALEPLEKGKGEILVLLSLQ